MTTDVIMPQLGESIVEGTVGKWLAAEGEAVRQDQPLLQVITDKIETELSAPITGVLLKIYVPEGQTVAKGTVLAVIGEQVSEVREQESGGVGQPASATSLAQRMAAEHGLDLAEVAGTGAGGRITRRDVAAHLAASSDIPDTSRSNLQPPPSRLGFISPAVSRLAGELGVDLTQVIGTGRDGRITKKDVLAYVAAPVPREEPARDYAAEVEEFLAWRPSRRRTRQPADGAIGALGVPPVASKPLPSSESEFARLSPVRRATAEHMALSVRTSPHVTTVMEADMARVVLARQRLQGEFERQGVGLTFTPFFVQAVVAGLKAVPQANSTLQADVLLIHKRIHVGMAVATPDGLIVPVIRDANEKSLLGLARAVNDLAERARSQRLAPDEVQGGTFTLTNHGTAGSLLATPIIVQPQAGILGVGAIRKRPVVIARGHPLLPDADDTLAIRPMAYLSFTFDHRILDGQEADRFLMAVVRFLESYDG